jgi:hypothetical protein
MPGMNLTLLVGKTRQPAPRLLIEALQSVEITHSDSSRSGFKLVFQVGRASNRDLQDDPVLRSSKLTPFNRVIVVIAIQAKAQVLMDGIITHHEFASATTPGRATLSVIGEDDKKVQHPQQSEKAIVTKIINSSDYADYGLMAKIQEPLNAVTPTKKERIPAQAGSDLAYLQKLGTHFDYVFFITPGPRIGQNTAFWGFRPRGTRPQAAITVNMGPYTNTESVNVKYDAQAATQVQGRIQDRKTNQIRPLNAISSDRPPLAAQSALQLQRQQLVRRVRTYEETGHEYARAVDQTQAMVNRAAESTVTVTGEIDALRYGAILNIRELVPLRGVGYTHDGLYYVKSVTHRIRKGQYQQQFTITREGRNSTISSVGR